MLGNFIVDFLNDSYTFSRPLSNKVCAYKRDYEDKITIIQEAYGVSEDNISVEVVKEYGAAFLKVKGSTKNDVLNATFEFSNSFRIDPDTIKEINYKSKDGLLYIDLVKKEPEKPSIKISKVEE